MSYKTKFKVSLRISHPTKTAEEFIEKLKIKPWISRTAGQHRTGLNSSSFIGINAYTFLTCPLETEGYTCFEDLLNGILDSQSLEDEQYLQEVVNSGGTLELAIGLCCNRNDELFFDRNLIEKAARKQINVSIDIFVESE